MFKKIMVAILLAATLLFVLPYAAGAACPIHEGRCTEYTCEICGTNVPLDHPYIGSRFFGLSQYCPNCNAWFFTPKNLDWIGLIMTVGGLALIVFFIVRFVKKRKERKEESQPFPEEDRPGMEPEQAAKMFGLIEQMPPPQYPRSPQTSNEPTNPGLLLHVLKEEDKRPKD